MVCLFSALEKDATTSSHRSDSEVGLVLNDQNSTMSQKAIAADDPVGQSVVEAANSHECFLHEIQPSLPELQPFQSAMSDGLWLKKPSTPIASFFYWSFWLLSNFIQIMAWLQSSDISPLAASAILLLFSHNRLIANVVALLLGAMFYSGLVVQNVKGHAHQHDQLKTSCNTHTTSGKKHLHDLEAGHQSAQHNTKPESHLDQAPLMVMMGASRMESESRSLSRKVRSPKLKLLYTI